MKHALHRTLALLLAAALLASSAGATSLGSWLRQDTLELSDTAYLTHGVLNQTTISAKQTENVVTYTPETTARPIVAFGSTLYGRSNLNYVASYLAGAGKNVLAGINGSFFDMNTGIPYGCVITDGILRTSGDIDSVGFRSDGSAVIGKPGLDIKITYANGNVLASHYNKAISKTSGTVLYSRDYDTKTKNGISAYNVVLKPSSATLKVGQTITAQVTAIAADTASCEIPSGGMVLSMATDTAYPNSMNTCIKTLSVGDTVSIACTVSEDWKDVQYACGGGDLLVSGGAAQTSFTLDSAAKRTCRTAVGLKSDGSVVLYTVDGLQSGYSAGLTLAELAVRMKELGCVTALNLDGGGSTTLSARYPGNSSLTAVNQPSDGAQRNCANFIFLVADSTAAGPAVRLHLYPYDAVLLCGAGQQLTVKATDSNYNAAEIPAEISYDTSDGTVTQTGIFYAGDTDTTAVVTASSGDVSGTREIRVVKTPSAIAIKDESTAKAITSLSVASGGSASLTAAATFGGYDLVSQDRCYTWAVTGGIGTIDASGKFTAVETTSAKTGTITCTAGGATASVTVSVGAAAPSGGALLGFEAGETAVTSGTGITASVNSALAYVRYGARSLKLQYDLSKVTAADSAKRQVTAALSQTLPDGCDTMGLWIYGDNSNNSLSLQFSDGQAASSKWVAQFNFTGWKYVTAAIPAGATTLTGITVTEYDGAAASAGTFYLDQLIAASGALSDTTPPAISASLSGSALTASVTDSGSGVSSLAVTLDGATQSVSLADGKVTLSLPDDAAAHKVQITASDACGNLASKSVAVSGTLADPFSDLDGHWSKAYVDYCYRENLLAGSADSAGNLIYRPDDSMTRQEFAVAVVRFLGIDPDAYAIIELPFADSSQVAAWATGSMKAAYGLGLITGSETGGKLYANPTATITRQEAMAILGRTQARGFAEDSLSSFSDSASVASWARSDIAAMVMRGIIAGSGGKLNPGGTVTRAQVAKMLYSLY